MVLDTVQHLQLQLHLLLVVLELLLVLHLLVLIPLVIVLSKQFMLAMLDLDIQLPPQLLFQIQKDSVVLVHTSLMKLLLENGLRLKQGSKIGIKIQIYLKYLMSVLVLLNLDSSLEKLSEEKTLEQSMQCNILMMMIYTINIVKMMTLSLRQIIS